MIDRSNQRWNSAFTIFTGNLNEDIQKYRDYFETDI